MKAFEAQWDSYTQGFKQSFVNGFVRGLKVAASCPLDDSPSIEAERGTAAHLRDCILKLVQKEMEDL